MKVVVQKFGGTCVESVANQLTSAERIMEARARGLQGEGGRGPAAPLRALRGP